MGNGGHHHHRTNLIRMQSACALLTVAMMLGYSHCYTSEAMIVAPTTITQPESQTFELEPTIDKVSLKCKFVKVGAIYLCRLTNLNLMKPAEIGAISGKHLKGKTNADVRGIHFKSGTMNFLPTGIEKFFPNLISLVAGDDYDHPIAFKNIQRSTLSKLRKLTMLSIFTGTITKLDNDAFWDLPVLKDFLLSGKGNATLHQNAFQKNTRLREVVILGVRLNTIPANLFRSNLMLDAVYIQDCNLTSINASFFEKNTRLALASFHSNKLVTLPKDLFKYNPLLEVIDFSDNLLKTIEIDFTRFNMIDSIDLEDNVCIDQFFETDAHKFDDTYTNLSEFQNLIKANCSRHANSPSNFEEDS